MPDIRVRDAAELLGVSDDTVRRWIDDGALSAHQDQSGRKAIDGAELGAVRRATMPPARPKDPLGIGSSARNRFTGLVTSVVTDNVMAQVEMQCGPFTVVSLMSAEAVARTEAGAGQRRRRRRQSHHRDRGNPERTIVNHWRSVALLRPR